MYRCHFLQSGRITQGYNLRVETLDAAIATSRKILADHLDPDACDGLQIWLDTAMLYEFCVDEGRKRSNRRRATVVTTKVIANY